jgi:hypothetical protein
MAEVDRFSSEERNQREPSLDFGDDSSIDEEPATDQPVPASSDVLEEGEVSEFVKVSEAELVEPGQSAKASSRQKPKTASGYQFCCSNCTRKKTGRPGCPCTIESSQRRVSLGAQRPAAFTYIRNLRFYVAIPV